MPKRRERKPPEPGNKYKKTYKGETYTLRVVSASGRIAYRVGSDTYSSPTAAAKAITENEVNGWKFWGMDDEQVDS